MSETRLSYRFTPQLSFTLTGRVVPKARSRHNGDRSYLPVRYRQWKVNTVRELKSLIAGFDLTELPIQQASIEITLMGDRRGDANNLAGALLDCLVSAGILYDDRLACIPQLSVNHCPGKRSSTQIDIKPL
ncbi:MAG: RusA family crossover junction endodeoxyribonuclease [Hydrococcus sp. Prado102]|jgi:Holliday junction resolvase RusA-like endonuclease|nr:RusA family crossover junction endodeoxyribonuclease [Hydrococcus sp. Prado102]